MTHLQTTSRMDAFIINPSLLPYNQHSRSVRGDVYSITSLDLAPAREVGRDRNDAPNLGIFNTINSINRNTPAPASCITSRRRRGSSVPLSLPSTTIRTKGNVSSRPPFPTTSTPPGSKRGRSQELKSLPTVGSIHKLRDTIDPSGVPVGAQVPSAGESYSNNDSGKSSNRSSKSNNRSRDGSNNSSDSRNTSSQSINTSKNNKRSNNSSSRGGRHNNQNNPQVLVDPRKKRIAANAARRSSVIARQKDYLHFMKAVGLRGTWREIPDLLSEMRQKSIPPNVFIYNAAISAMARCRRPAEAEALLTTMLECDNVAPDKITYNSVINAHARMGNLEAAQRLLDRMRELGKATGIRPDVISFNTVADAAAKRGDSVAATKLLAIMAQDGVAPDVITYNACLAACKSQGDARRAISLLEFMQDDGIIPDQRSYSAVIAALGRRGEWSEVGVFLEKMKREGLSPDRLTYNTAIAAFAFGRQADMALSLLEEMNAVGLSPDARSYTSALGACGRAGEWEASLGLLREMQAKGVQPSAYSYSAAIDACSKAGQQFEALSLLDEMRHTKLTPDTVAYNSAIDACSVCGDWASALKLLLEMKAGTKGAPPPDVISYGGALTACAHAGRVDEALDLLSELRSNESKAAAAAAARGKGRGGQGGGDMRRALPVPNLVIYSSAIYACLKAGEVPRGTELLEEMIASGIPPNDIHCDAIIAAWSSCGEPERAMRLMKRMQSHGFVPSLRTYETLVWAYAQVGDWEKTVRFLASILAKGLKPRGRSWDAAIAAAGHWERALALLAEMRRQGIRPSKMTYTVAVAGLNRPRCAEWGPKLAKLAFLLQERPQQDSRSSGLLNGPSPADFNNSIEALGDAGNPSGAACLLRVMRDEGFQASPRAYRAVIYALARVERLSEAMALAQEMQSSAAGMRAGQSQPGPKSESHEGVTLPPSPSVAAENDEDRPFSNGDGGSEVQQTKSHGAAAGVLAGGAAPPCGSLEEDDFGREHNGHCDDGDEDDDDLELDMTVVYNSIISNFAHTAKRGTEYYRSPTGRSGDINSDSSIHVGGEHQLRPNTAPLNAAARDGEWQGSDVDGGGDGSGGGGGDDGGLADILLDLGVSMKSR